MGAAVVEGNFGSVLEIPHAQSQHHCGVCPGEYLRRYNTAWNLSKACDPNASTCSTGMKCTFITAFPHNGYCEPV